MFTKALKYSLKVWLTGVLVSPLIFVFTSYIQSRPSQNSHDQWYWPLALYPIFILFETIFSCSTWLIFLLLSWFALSYIKSLKAAVAMLILTAIVLTVTTFILIMHPEVDMNDGFFQLMVYNSAVIGIGAWFYLPSLPNQLYSAEGL